MAGNNFHEAVKKDFNLRGLVSDLREQKWRGTGPSQIERILWIADGSSIDSLAQFAVTKKEWDEAWAAGVEDEIVDEYMDALAEALSKEMDEHVYATFKEEGAYIGQYEDMAPADLRAMGFEIEGSRKHKKKKAWMSGLSDVPLPPNIERPEMWTVEAVVQAVADGFTFMVPFHDQGGSMFSPNAYWIKGQQASAHALTVGPHHTPEIGLINVADITWIRALTYFQHQIVPKEAWIGPINENGAVAVHVEIDPATIDWEWLNRGHQIRVKRGL